MNTSVELQPPEYPEDIPGEVVAPLTRLRTAVGLGALSAVAYYSEHKGYNKELPMDMRKAADSLCHPVLGFVGAWAGATFAGRISNGVKKAEVASALVLATVLDFGAEQAQSMTAADTIYKNYLASHNLPETSKDYIFALGGAGLFFWQEYKNKRTLQAD